ncbi:MAG: hypothetical protein ACREMD_02650 [Gemmatimonadota bacterium]
MSLFKVIIINSAFTAYRTFREAGINVGSEFRAVLEVAARLQEVVPDAVLVGESAAAHHAGHRISLDDDHTLSDLQGRFDEVLVALEQTEGWVTSRIRPQVLILGSLDGVETGIRQLIRRRPLEVEQITVGDRMLRVPTLEEILRIKSWLILRRNATRDYLDVVALAERMDLLDAARVILRMDEYYEDQIGPGGRRVATQLAKQLADPAPYDLSEVDLGHYRELQGRWRDWDNVVEAARRLAAKILDLLAAGAG